MCPPWIIDNVENNKADAPQLLFPEEPLRPLKESLKMMNSTTKGVELFSMPKLHPRHFMDSFPNLPGHGILLLKELQRVLLSWACLLGNRLPKFGALKWEPSRKCYQFIPSEIFCSIHIRTQFACHVTAISKGKYRHVVLAAYQQHFPFPPSFAE